jgi:MYXO-CTERM domain-containing protein
MNRIHGTLAIGAVVVAGSAASAGVAFTGTYTFPNQANQPNSRPYNGAAIANVIPGAIGISNGVTYDPASSASNNRFSAYGWDPAGTINLSDYFTFTLTAASGYTLDKTSITFKFSKNIPGPTKWQWRSSVDNFASTLTNYTAIDSDVTNSSGVLSISGTQSVTATNNTLTLTGAAFSGLASVEFRLYAYDAASSGTAYAYLGSPLTFSGSVNAVPAPGAIVLLGMAGIAAGRRRRA